MEDEARFELAPRYVSLLAKESLRIDELAEVWDVSTYTIRRLIKRGEMKTFLQGKTIRIPQSERLEFEKRHSTGRSEK